MLLCKGDDAVEGTHEGIFLDNSRLRMVPQDVDESTRLWYFMSHIEGKMYSRMVCRECYLGLR